MHLTVSHEEGRALGMKWEAPGGGGGVSQPALGDPPPHPHRRPTHLVHKPSLHLSQPSALTHGAQKHTNLADFHLNLSSASHYSDDLGHFNFHVIKKKGNHTYFTFGL